MSIIRLAPFTLLGQKQTMLLWMHILESLIFLWLLKVIITLVYAVSLCSYHTLMKRKFAQIHMVQALMFGDHLLEVQLYTVFDFNFFVGHCRHPCWMAHWHFTAEFAHQLHFRFVEVFLMVGCFLNDNSNQPKIANELSLLKQHIFYFHILSFLSYDFRNVLV